MRVRGRSTARLWGPAKLRDMRDCELLRPLAASPLADREATSPCQTAATRRRRADGDGEPAETEARRRRRADGDGDPAEAEMYESERRRRPRGDGDPAEAGVFSVSCLTTGSCETARRARSCVDSGLPPATLRARLRVSPGLLKSCETADCETARACETASQTEILSQFARPLR